MNKEELNTELIKRLQDFNRENVYIDDLTDEYIVVAPTNSYSDYMKPRRIASLKKHILELIPDIKLIWLGNFIIYDANEYNKVVAKNA